MCPTSLRNGIRRAARRGAALVGPGLLAAAVLLACPARPATGQEAAPGGFIEPAGSTAVRPRVRPALPPRGPFTFPDPYGTTGVRLTNASDCGGGDCVTPVGYSYWRTINNHAGQRTMLIVLALDRRSGGAGPSLFTYDKAVDEVTEITPLFDAGDPLSWASAEGWYFSATRPTALYVPHGPRLHRYDVATRQLEPVFDVTAQFGAEHDVWQAHSSDDDRVHSATLRRTTDWHSLGCVVYNELSGLLSYFPFPLAPVPPVFERGTAVFDECQVDKSGRWLVMKDNVDGLQGEDNVVIDLLTGVRHTLTDPAGAGGHSDNGFGYMVAADNWNSRPGAVRLWQFGLPFPSAQPGTPPQGRLVYHTADWGVDVGHVAHSNARAGLPASGQYACGSNALRQQLPRSNEIYCFPLDGSLQVLVVAPVMTDLNAAGGGTEDYAKLPKGNLDVTGQYFIWTSNTGGARLDAFLVKVPAHLLVGDAPPEALPGLSVRER